LAEELVDHAVDDLVLDAAGAGGIGGLGEGGLAGAEKEAVGLAEHVGFVGDGDEGFFLRERWGGKGGGAGAGGWLLAHLLSAEGDVAGHGGDAAAGVGADAFDSFGDLAVAAGVRVGLFFLDVEVFGVFAYDDEVDGGLGRGLEGGGEHALAGSDVGVQGEAFAQRHDGRGVAGHFGGWGAGLFSAMPDRWVGGPIGIGIRIRIGIVIGIGTEIYVTYLTAPKSAPSHSFCSISTVFSGNAVPVALK
jgi:hypothetical protein